MPDDNDFDSLLTSTFPSLPDAGLRETLLIRTQRLLRQRRRFKKAGLFAGLAACYLAGLATTSLLSPKLPAPNDPERVLAKGEEPDTTPKPTNQVADSPSLATISGPQTTPLDQDPNAPAIVFERVAAQVSANEQPHLYRCAGDRYLEHDADLVAAVRCYARALDCAPTVDLTIAPDDSWLLIALKRAKQEEIRRAKTSS